MNVQELETALKQSGPAPVYVVIGDEDLLRDRAVAAIKAAAVPAEAGGLAEFNLDIVYGDEADGAEIRAKAEEVPAFAERRCLVVKAADKLSAADTERLLDYVKDPVASTTLIFTGPKLDGRTKFAQALKQQAVTVECGLPYEPQVADWIRREAASVSVKLSDDAVAVLKDLAVSLKDSSGGVLYLVRRELEKLAAYVGPDKTAGPAECEAVRGGEAGASVFDLSHAIAARDRARALRILARNLEAGEDPLRILGALVWQYRTIWKAKDALREGKLGQVEGLLQARRRGSGFNPRDFLAKFPEPSLSAAFRLFLETDSKLKGGAAAAARSRTLEALVLSLCEEADPRAPVREPPAAPAARAQPARSSSNVRTVRKLGK